MKFFAAIVVFVGFAAATLCAEDTKPRSVYGDGAHASHGVHAVHSAPGGYAYGGGYGGVAGHGAAAGYGGVASVPALPCPNNYLFSCQPNLQPAPCSHAAPSYGSVGAYSENYPVYALQVPQYVNGYQTY